MKKKMKSKNMQSFLDKFQELLKEYGFKLVKHKFNQKEKMYVSDGNIEDSIKLDSYRYWHVERYDSNDKNQTTFENFQITLKIVTDG